MPTFEIHSDLSEDLGRQAEERIALAEQAFQGVDLPDVWIVFLEGLPSELGYAASGPPDQVDQAREILATAVPLGVTSGCGVTMLIVLASFFALATWLLFREWG